MHLDQVVPNLADMAPALLFLCTGVPLAALLERLGFFDAVAVVIDRRWTNIPVGALWAMAAVTTVTLNLDTTIVLLTPLYVRLARRAGVDPLPVALVPLLLASLASSVLPVSNLTTLIAVGRFDLSVLDVVGHLAPASVVAVGVGWLAYRRRWPTVLPGGGRGTVDLRALRIGGVTVAAVLIGFVVGPSFGLDPWVVALSADVVLAAILRWVPWREIPLATALGVAGVAAAVTAVVGPDRLHALLDLEGPVAVGAIALVGTAASNVVNNLPAVLVAFDSTETMTWGAWAWLGGANTGAVLLPMGALANLLWWRIVRDEGLRVDLRAYTTAVVPVALPALVAAVLTLAVTSVINA